MSQEVGSLSRELLQRAQRIMPGGVNSPVRAFRAVGGQPVFIERGAGATMWDVDGQRYIEYVGSWGPLLFGHAHPKILGAIQETLQHGTSFGAPSKLEVDLAELIVQLVPSIEMVRLVNSGTEATMSAVRLARAFTERSKFIKFSGNYHGHGDGFLIKAGSGVMTLGLPDSPGVTAATAADTLLAEYNDLDDINQLFESHKESIACVILEPVVGNMGLVPPQPGFLQGVRELCSKHGALLIFDEVMTGFRLAPGGAQELFGITPDLSTFGKIIGGGMPIGAYGGKAEIMKMVAPSGPMYQAGTLSGNPIAVSAGLAMLTLIRDTPDLYSQLESKGAKLETGIQAHLQRLGIQACVQRMGSMWTLFFQNGPVHNFKDAVNSDTKTFAKFHAACLKRGVYLAPSQFEACFISAAHENALIDETLTVMGEAFDELTT